MQEIRITRDHEIDIATAPTRRARRWTNRTGMRWSQLVRRCAAVVRTPESVAEYMRMSRDEQAAVKDVGGFVGGYLSGGHRRKDAVLYRTLVTLDIDSGRPSLWDDFTLAYSCAAMLYSTHKHTPAAPRYRLVIPLRRHVSAAEYEPIARRIAADIGIDQFDPTTYQAERLFYYASASRDGEFVHLVQDGPALDPDEVLATYRDPSDISEWPLAAGEHEVVRTAMRRAGDPWQKPGLIGAYCRAHPLSELLAGELADVYEPTATPGRYTYRRGSLAGGLVTYDDRWAYSHHSTDPAGCGHVCNAFDLMRIHRFGHLDPPGRRTEPDSPDASAQLPSYKAMLDHAGADAATCRLLTEERLRDFDGIVLDQESDKSDQSDPSDKSDPSGAPDLSWTERLRRDRRGATESTADNIVLILENDPALAGHLWHDEFTGFDTVRGGLPWNPDATVWTGRDDANLRIYLERAYGITGRDKIADARASVLTRRSYHPVRDYLRALRWDGTPRLETLVIDYIGAEDTPLTRAMTRKHFAAAVARVMEPGCKYDYCLLLAGPEGCGKSTLFAVMGGRWFSDSVLTADGRQGMEQLRCAWIVELSELAGIRRSEVETVKAYISRTDDIFRPAYGTVTEHHPRQCVFCGSTNEQYFLKGDTGNRRFWVIAVDPALRRIPAEAGGVRAALLRDRDQLWAEAVETWRRGERLYLDGDLEQAARDRQQQHSDNGDDPMADMLAQVLDTPLPPTWDTWTLAQRRQWWTNPDPLDPAPVVRRDRLCVAEFLCERMGMDMRDKDYRFAARRAARLLAAAGWTGPRTSRHAAALYGVQKTFYRPLNDSDNEPTAPALP